MHSMHHVGADVAPLQVGRIALGGQADLLAVDDHGVAVDGDVAVEIAVHRVVLQHVGQVVGIEQVVDADDFDILEILRDGAERHAADTAETVDTNFDCHAVSLSTVVVHEAVNRSVPTTAQSRLARRARRPRDLEARPPPRSTTFSAVKPNSLNSAPAGADSPKRSMPTTLPWSGRHTCTSTSVTPASTATRRGDRLAAAPIRDRPRPGHRTRRSTAWRPRAPCLPLPCQRLGRLHRESRPPNRWR